MGEEYYYAKDYTKALKWVLFTIFVSVLIPLQLNDNGDLYWRIYYFCVYSRFY